MAKRNGGTSIPSVGVTATLRALRACLQPAFGAMGISPGVPGREMEASEQDRRGSDANRVSQRRGSGVVRTRRRSGLDRPRQRQRPDEAVEVVG